MWSENIIVFPIDDPAFNIIWLGIKEAVKKLDNVDSEPEIGDESIYGWFSELKWGPHRIWDKDKRNNLRYIC